jgi:hypothetical protein
LIPPDLQISDQEDNIQHQCQRGEESKRVRLTWRSGYDVNLPYGTRIEYNGEELNPPFVDITVPCGSSFKWEVIAENGSSSHTLTFSLLFPDTTPPLAPRLRAPGEGERRTCNNQDVPITFQWDFSQDSASSDGAVVSGVAGYEVSLQISQDGGLSWQDRERSGQLPGNQWPTSVPCGYGYRWTVRAIDGAGNQSEGYWRTLSTGPDQTPPPPPALRQPTGPVKCEPVERQQVTLGWSSVSDESGISGYQVVVEQRFGTNPWTVIANQFVTNTYYTVNVLCDYEYQWYVIAVDGQGNRSSRPSNWYRFAVVR